MTLYGWKYNIIIEFRNIRIHFSIQRLYMLLVIVYDSLQHHSTVSYDCFIIIPLGIISSLDILPAIWQVVMSMTACWDYAIYPGLYLAFLLCSLYL